MIKIGYPEFRNPPIYKAAFSIAKSPEWDMNGNEQRNITNYHQQMDV
jgi:hypothetical protein